MVNYGLLVMGLRGANSVPPPPIPTAIASVFSGGLHPFVCVCWGTDLIRPNRHLVQESRVLAPPRGYT